MDSKYAATARIKDIWRIIGSNAEPNYTGAQRNYEHDRIYW